MANYIAHLMTTLIEHRFVWFMGIGGIKRKEEHASLCAKLFLVSWRVPARAKSFGRKNYPLSSSFRNQIAACFFARTHESSNSGSTRADAFGYCGKSVPFWRFPNQLSRALERNDNRQVEDLRIAVGEPLASAKFDFANLPKVLAIGVAQPSSGRILLDITAKGGELTAFFDNPIVPLGFENRRQRLRRRATRKTRAGFACSGVCRYDAPIFGAQGLCELADQDSQGDAVWRLLDFNQQMKMVGHYYERRNLIEASPFQVETLDNRGEGLGKFVFYKLICPDSGKVNQSLDSFQGYHIEIWRFIIKTEKPGHVGIIANGGRR